MNRIEIIQRAFLASYARDRANVEFLITGKRDEIADSQHAETMRALAIEWEFANETSGEINKLTNC